MDLERELGKVLDETRIVDTHEHLFFPGTVDLAKDIPNILKKCYAHRDLVSAGMSPQGFELLAETIDPQEGWARMAPFLPAARNTSLHRYALRSLGELYQISERDLQGNGWMAASERIRQAHRREGWFDRVFQEKANIRVCLLDHYRFHLSGNYEADSPLYIPVLRIDDFLMGSPFITWNPGNSATEIAQRLGMGEIRCLDDLIDLVDAVFQRYAAAGGKAVKVAMAYNRSLQFQGASRAEASYQFDQVLAGAFGPDTEKVSDFMLDYCIQRSIDHRLPIQIHTGMQDGNGLWTWLERAMPTHLTNLFIWHPQARFVILHGGFPFTQEAGVLAKTFPNVYLDFAWVPLLSPTGAVNALSHWLEMVPGNKIMWGGDVHTVEELYGAVLALKDVLRTVLTRKVQSGYLTLDHAAELARAIMADNAARLFGLNARSNALERNEVG